MFRGVLLFICLAVVSAELDFNKCEKLFETSTINCCKDAQSFTNDEQLKDCFEIPFDPRSGERLMCLFKKRGLATDDGMINKEALAEYVGVIHGNNSEMVKTVVEKCIFSDVSKYGPPDLCDAVKLQLCLEMHFKSECSEWDDSPRCEDTKKLATECKSILK